MAGVNHLRVLSKLTTQNKFEIADVRDVGARIFSSRLMRAWEGTLSIALGAGDRAFWMSQFRASLAQMQAAAEKNGEWTGQPTPEMIEAAMAEAAYAIYQNPNIVSANANKIRGALNRLSTFGKTDQYGLGTGLMAFTQVPGSITLRGLVEWSPLGMIPALYRGMRGILYASSTGRIGAKFDQAAFNKEFTQALLGTGALYAAGYYLYALGIVTASREDDDDLEAMRRASGGGAYRINLTALRRALLSGNWFTRQEGEQGDVIVPYDWAQPVAITFAAGAELAAQVERNSREQLKKGLAEKAGMAAMSLAAGAKSLEELPLLSGFSSFIKTWGYAGPLEALTATVAGMPSQFVPQLVRQAGQINDNLVRETRGGDGVVQREFMKVLASVPGYSTKFPVRFDITGQAIQRYQYGGNSVLNVFFSPAMAAEVKRNPVLQEVSRLVDATGDAAAVPRQVRRGTKINGVDVDLTNDQLSAYSYYLGNFTMSHFAWRMAAPVYARLPDEVKVKMLAQDITDIDAAVKSAVLGADMRRLTRNQMFLRQALVNSPLGQSVPPE
jgi:cytochrome c556